MDYQILDKMPSWGFFLFIATFSFFIFEVGFRLGIFIFHKSLGKPPMESMVTAMMGMLAFILAFTFSFAANHFENRRTVVLEEANAITTTYLRSKYLPEPYKRTIPPLLKDYVTLRLEALKSRNVSEILEKSDSIQKDLWNQVVLLVEAGHTNDVFALFIESMNQIFDLHSKRAMLAFGIKIPNILWSILLLLIFISIGAMGYLAGFRETRNIGISFLVIISFSSVVYLISDLEHSQEGFIRVSQKPLITTLEMMQRDS